MDNEYWMKTYFQTLKVNNFLVEWVLNDEIFFEQVRVRGRCGCGSACGKTWDPCWFFSLCHLSSRGARRVEAHRCWWVLSCGLWWFRSFRTCIRPWFCRCFRPIRYLTFLRIWTSCWPEHLQIFLSSVLRDNLGQEILVRQLSAVHEQEPAWLD